MGNTNSLRESGFEIFYKRIVAVHLSDFHSKLQHIALKCRMSNTSLLANTQNKLSKLDLCSGNDRIFTEVYFANSIQKTDSLEVRRN